MIDTILNTVSDISSAANLKTTDNVLIRTRDQIFQMFRKAGISEQSLSAAVNKNKMAHADIPDVKIGKDYSPEWARLYQMVIDLFINFGRSDLANYFQMNVPMFTPQVHDTSYIAQLLIGNIAPATSTPATTTTQPTTVTASAGQSAPDTQTMKYALFGLGAFVLVGAAVYFAKGSDGRKSRGRRK